MATRKSQAKTQIEANAYVAASIPEEELVFAYRYYRWKKRGAQGDPPRVPKPAAALFPRRLPPSLVLQGFGHPEAAKSFDTWVKREIVAKHKIVNNAAIQPPLPGVDEDLDKAFAEYRQYLKDLEAARKIAKKVAMQVLTDAAKERLKAKAKKAEAKAKAAHSKGFEEGRLKGHDEYRSDMGKHDEAIKRAEKAEAELDKPHLKMNRDEWEKAVFAEVKSGEEYFGAKGAVRIALVERVVIEGAKHFKIFGSNGQCNPTFEGMLKAYKRSKEKQSAKKETKPQSRKRKGCDCPDGEAKGPDVPVKDPLSKPAQRVRTVTRK